MPEWPFTQGIFTLTGQQLDVARPPLPGAFGGGSPRRNHSKKRLTARAQQLKQRRKLESSVRDDWVVPEPVPEPEEAQTFHFGESAPGAAEAQSPKEDEEEEEEEDLNNITALDWRRDPEKPVIRTQMTSNVNARARWQVAFAKVREITASHRKRQHRVALGMKVKEYLMFHHLRGTCGRMNRTVDSFERSIFSDKTEKMEITYESFSEGVVPEADEWVRKNFEDMREALEPVVQNEQFRKYDMNELERMLRMKEQEDSWLDAQQKATEDLLQTHGKLMERSVTSLEDMVRQVRQVLSALAAEIAGGLQRHHNLKAEHDTAENESFDMSQKQKKLMTQIDEFEARQKEAKERYARELEQLTQEFLKVRRATTSVKFQLAKDEHYCERLLQKIQDTLATQMADHAKVMAEEHIKRIQRKWDVRQREKIMRQATYEKELQELRERLRKRQTELEERRTFLELSVCRSKATQAKLLLFELRARTQEIEKEAPAQRKTLKRLFSSKNLSFPTPQQGLLMLLGEELQLQRKWLTERGQDVELTARSFQIRGKQLLATPTSLIQRIWQRIMEFQDPSRSALTRVFRDELSEQRALSQRPEELQQMTGQLFDGQQVQQAVDKALTSLEVTRRSQRTLAEHWAVFSSVEGSEVHDALTEKLEELDQGLNVAETSTRWLREPDQNSAQNLTALTSKEELLWLNRLSNSLSVRCGQLRAGSTVLEACQNAEDGSKAEAVGKLLSGMSTLLNEDMLKAAQRLSQRTKHLLAKRQKLQDEMLESWSRRMSVHQEESHAESVSEGLGSLIYLLEDRELKETPQDEVTPAELLNILHCTAARVFKHRKSQVFDWAMMGLSDMDKMVSEAVLSEQAARAPEEVQVVSELEVENRDLLPSLPVDSLIEQNMEPPSDLLQSMEELAAVLDSTAHEPNDPNDLSLAPLTSSVWPSPAAEAKVENLQEPAAPAENDTRPRTAAAPSVPPPEGAFHSTVPMEMGTPIGTVALSRIGTVALSRPSSFVSAEQAPPMAAEVDEMMEHPTMPAMPVPADGEARLGAPGPPAAPGSRPTSSARNATALPQTEQAPAEATSPPALEQQLPAAPGRSAVSEPTPILDVGNVAIKEEPKPESRTNPDALPDSLKPSVAPHPPLPKLETSAAKAETSSADMPLPGIALERLGPPTQQADVQAPDESSPNEEKHVTDTGDVAVPAAPGDLLDPMETMQATVCSPDGPDGPDAIPIQPGSVASPALSREDIEADDGRGQQREAEAATIPSPVLREAAREEAEKLWPEHQQETSMDGTKPTAESSLLTPQQVANRTTIARAAEEDRHRGPLQDPQSPKTLGRPMTELERHAEQVKPAKVEIEQNVGPDSPQATAEDDSERLDALSAIVSANFSRRIAEQPGVIAAGSASVEFEDHAVKEAPTHVNAMQTIRANSGVSATWSPKSTSPKAKGKRRRPRAMTRLGKELDDEEPEEVGADQEVGEESPKTTAEGDDGDHFRDKLEAILAKHFKAKEGSDRAKEAKELAAQMNKTQVTQIKEVLQPEVLELQQALMAELQNELNQVSQQIEAPDRDVPQEEQQELQRRANALQEHLLVVQAISTLPAAHGDNLLQLALAEMAAESESPSAHAAAARRVREKADSEASPLSTRGLGSRGSESWASNLVKRFPRQNSPASPLSPKSAKTPQSPKPPMVFRGQESFRAETASDEAAPLFEESEDQASHGQKLWKRGKFIVKFLAGLKGFMKPSEHHHQDPQDAGKLQLGNDADTESEAKVAAMKLRKPEAWGRTPQVNEEDHQEMSLSGSATGPKKEVQPSPSPKTGDALVLPGRRKTSVDVVDIDSLVAIGQSLEAERDEEVDNDEDYLEQPGPAWVDSWVQSAEDKFFSGIPPLASGALENQKVPAEPMVSILSLQAEGTNNKGAGNRGLKGSNPRRGAPRFIRDKGSKKSHASRPEENVLMDFGKPKSVSIREEPEEVAVPQDMQQEPRSDTPDERPVAPAQPLHDAPDVEATKEDALVAEEISTDELRRNSDVSSGPEEEPEQRRDAEEESDHVLARHPSKTAVGKLYRQNSKGSKLDMLLRSRSFRSGTSLNLTEPDDDDDRKDELEAEMEDLETDPEDPNSEDETKRQMAVRRWKLGTLGIQAVLRLRDTIRSPASPAGSRRSSFAKTRVVTAAPDTDGLALPVLPALPTLPTLPTADAGGAGPSALLASPKVKAEAAPKSAGTLASPKGKAEAAPKSAGPLAILASPKVKAEAAPKSAGTLASPKVKAAAPKRDAAPPKLPQVPAAPQAVVEDVPGLVRRTSITPRSKPAAVRQLQAPDAANVVAFSPAATAAAKRLPPAPPPPKTAVRQNGPGDVTAKNSLDRGDNLTLTAATIQAVHSLDKPYLGTFGKSEQRLLSAHTQSTHLSHDDSHLTLSKDSAYSSAGFSPYASQTELHKMSTTNLSYQSSVAKFSVDSRDREELKEENVEVLEVEPDEVNLLGYALPLLDRKSFGVETALMTPTGKLLGSPGCWNPGLSKEVGEIHVAHAGHVLELRSLPVLPGKKGATAKAKPKGPKLVLTNLAKPKKKRQLIQAIPAEGRSEPRRQPLYTRGLRL